MHEFKNSRTNAKIPPYQKTTPSLPHASGSLLVYSFVVHWDLPKSMDGLYQELGRAGRDGAPAISVVYHSEDSAGLLEWLAREKRIPSGGEISPPPPKKNVGQYSSNIHRIGVCLFVQILKILCRRVRRHEALDLYAYAVPLLFVLPLRLHKLVLRLMT